MKCHKCSYVSFDHLSECVKCGVNLEDIRSALGFSSKSPSVPFLLGVLLKDENIAKESHPVGLQTVGSSDEFSTIDMGEGFELFGDDEGQEDAEETSNLRERSPILEARRDDFQLSVVPDSTGEPSIFLDDDDDFSLTLSFDGSDSDKALMDELPELAAGKRSSVEPDAGEIEAEEDLLFDDLELEDAFPDDLVDFDSSADSPPVIDEEPAPQTQPARKSGKQGAGVGDGGYVMKPSNKGKLVKSGEISEELNLPEFDFEDMDLEELSLESEAFESSGQTNGQKRDSHDMDAAGQTKKRHSSGRGVS